LGCAGFSLIEIVLAVGIVSVALVAIFGMFSVSLKSSSETISQHEVLGATRAFNDFLRTTNSAQGFLNVSNWLTNDPGLFCYTTTNGAYTNGTSNTITDTINTRSGKLYRMVLGLSSNAPGISSVADIATNAFIPLQVKVYSVPSIGVSTTNLQPVFTYETAISR
jgi:prepilin-type N-terminal cleavage/methylation domain-containing protein